MARFVVGDIQGCFRQFEQLLALIGFNYGRDVLYLVGDLVNRGPQSLEVLQWVYKHQDRVVTVLGNHDIYLLGRYAGVIPADSGETIADVLTSPDAKKIINWLRRAPLIHMDSDYILVHAGIYPKMNFNSLLLACHSVANHFQAKHYGDFIEKIFTNKPKKWSEELEMLDQMRFAINSCTRMRYLNTDDYSLNFKYKGSLADQPDDLLAWFKTDFDHSINKKILFGHWASLGFFNAAKYISLDTGCVWGRKLTAFNLDSYEIAQVENYEV